MDENKKNKLKKNLMVSFSGLPFAYLGHYLNVKEITGAGLLLLIGLGLGFVGMFLYIKNYFSKE